MLLDRPPDAAIQAAVNTLQVLQAVDEQGRITDRGRRLALIGATPRLARALLDGAELVGLNRAAEIVAVISGDLPIGRGDDLVARWRDLRDGRDPGLTAQWRDEVRRLSTDREKPRATHHRGRTVGDDLAAGIIVGLAFPERLARLRASSNARGSETATAARNYLMVGGTGAQLNVGTELLGAPWLAIAVADRPAGRADARIRLAAPLDAETATQLGSGLRRTEDEIHWRDGTLVLRQREYLGAIALVERPLRNPDPAAVVAVVRDGVRADGLQTLPWPPSVVTLRRRMALLHRAIGGPWPDVSGPALLNSLQSWLDPDLMKVRNAKDLGRVDTGSALRRLLPWPAANRLDQLVPERIEVPSGSMVRVDYSAVDETGEGLPVLAVKVQEVFGWLQAPVIADGKVPVVLHLLSPGGRPTAVTADLASFWRQGYPQVRAELRSRYPRHAWPDDPLAAPPVKRPPRRGSKS